MKIEKKKKIHRKRIKRTNLKIKNMNRARHLKFLTNFPWQFQFKYLQILFFSHISLHIFDLFYFEKFRNEIKITPSARTG